MASPANTYVGLTHSGPGTAAGEPDKYYPTGKRNYIRLVAADDYQGASNAMLAQQLGYKSVFILNDKEAYGLGVATDFKNAATKLGLKIAGFTAWDPKASSYEALANKVKQSGADVVYLGGLECENGSKLIKDLRGALGKTFPLIAPDGFSSFSDTWKNSGGVANGMYISVAGQPNTNLPPAGKAFVKDFGAQVGAGPEPVLGVRRRRRCRSCSTRSRRPTATAPRSPTTLLQDEGHERHPRHVHDQRERRHEQQPGDPVQAGQAGQGRHVQDDHAAGEPREGRVGTQGLGTSTVSGEGCAALPGGASAARRSVATTRDQRGTSRQPDFATRPSVDDRRRARARRRCSSFWLAVNLVKTPYDFLEISLIGVTVGAVYALVALGYTLVYGILELINFAHGDVFMLGAMMCVDVH